LPTLTACRSDIGIAAGGRHAFGELLDPALPIGFGLALRTRAIAPKRTGAGCSFDVEAGSLKFVILQVKNADTGPRTRSVDFRPNFRT
jgi:hypothetical protein